MSRNFDDDALRAAYAPALRDSTTTHGPECPNEIELFAAVRGEGSEPERLRVLDHALKCPVCRRELALLHSVASVKPRAGASVAREFAWRRWVPAALAASVMLAVGLAGVGRWRGRSAEDITRAGGAGSPALVMPANGGAVRAGLVRFTWRSLAGVLRYTLEIDANDGTVLYTTQTRDTVVTATIPATAVGEDRWLVRAQMDDGSERRSETRVLRVR